MIKIELIVKDELLLGRYCNEAVDKIAADFKHDPMRWVNGSDVSVNIGTRCMDCGKQLEEPDGIPGILPGAWSRTNKKFKHIGFVCNDCSLMGKKEKENEE